MPEKEIHLGCRSKGPVAPRKNRMHESIGAQICGVVNVKLVIRGIAAVATSADADCPRSCRVVFQLDWLGGIVRRMRRWAAHQARNGGNDEETEHCFCPHRLLPAHDES